MEFDWNIFPGFTTAGILKEIQKVDGRITVIQRTSKTGSCSCQCLPTMFGMQKEMKTKIIQKELKNTLEDFLAVIGLSWGLDQKSSGTELTMAYQMDLGLERRRKSC